MTGTTVDRRAAVGLGPAVAGLLLITGTYGMARFGVGLFAPALVPIIDAVVAPHATATAQGGRPPSRLGAHGGSSSSPARRRSSPVPGRH